MNVKKHTTVNNHQPDKPGKKSHARLVIRLLLYPLVLLVILLLGALLFLQTETARSMVKTYIEQAAARHLQADLQIGKISGSLLFDISLEEIGISRRGDPILTAKKISAGYLPLLLLTRVLMLNEVEIDGMVLNLTRDNDGRLNLSTLIPAGEGSEISAPRPLSLTILVSRLSISGSTVVFSDRQTQTAPVRRISNIRLAAGLKLSPDGMVSARVINLALDIDKPAFSLDRLTGRVSYLPEKDRLDIKDIRIRTKESDLSVNGSLDFDPDDIEFNIRTALKALSLPEIGQILSIPALDRGRLTGTLQIKGTPAHFTHEAHLNLEGMSLSSSGPIQQNASGSFSVDIAAAVRNLNPAALPLVDLKGISGDINSDMHLQGSDLGRPGRRGLVTIELKPSRISGYDLSAGRIEAAFDADGIAVKDSFLAGPHGRMTVRRAHADMLDPARPGRLSLDASIQDLDPAISGRAGLSGKINLDVTAAAAFPFQGDNRFDPAAITAEISANIGPSGIQSIDLDRGRVQATWNGREIVIQELELSGAGSHLAVSGSLAPAARSSRLQFAGVLADLQKFAPLIHQLFPDRFPSGSNMNLQGRLIINGEIKGWWDRPDLSVAISGSHFAYDRFTAEAFHVKGTFLGPPDAFKLNAKADAQNLTVSGTRLPSVDLDWRQSPDTVTAGLALQYEKELTLTAKGRIDGWRRPDKEFTIDTLRLAPVDTHRAGPSFEEISNIDPIRLTLSSDGAVKINALNLTSNKAKLSLRGGLAADDRINTTLSLKGLDLNRGPWFIEGQDKFSGILSADLLLTGTLARPILSAHIHAKDAAGFDFSFSDLDILLKYSAQQAAFKATGYLQQSKVLDLSGEIGVLCSLKPFKFQLQNGGFKAAVTAQGLKLSALPIPKKKGLNFDGTLSLDARLYGDLSAPKFNGNLSVKDGFFAPENKDPRDYAFSDLKIDFRYKAAGIDINAALYRQKQKLLDLSGRAGMEISLIPFHFNLRDDNFKLHAAVRDLQLSMLPIPHKPGVDFDARLNVDATASGSLSNPVINGSLSLQDGFLNLATPALSYETFRAQVDFSPDGIVIKEFLLTGDTEGRLNLSGRIQTDGLEPTAFDIRLTGENVFVPYQKAVTARIRPDLTLTGTPQRPFLAGILTVTEGRVNLDQLSARGPAEIQIETTGRGKKATIDIVEEPGDAQELLRPLRADILVSVPRNAWLRGQGINAEMAGEVHLKKEPDKPLVLIGSLNTIRGTFDFQSKLFKITRGNVDFIGQEDLNPNLDIQVETRIARVTIIIKISGTADRMVLDLESDPAMDRTEIISYLVFGKPSSELNRQQSLNAEQAALNLTGRLAANELKNILGDAIRLDVLTLESGGGDISQGSLAIGKYITPEVFVLYRYRFKVDEPDLVEVSYEFNRNFSIETQLGDEKTTGIDFVWDFDF